MATQVIPFEIVHFDSMELGEECRRGTSYEGFRSLCAAYPKLGTAWTLIDGDLVIGAAGVIRFCPGVGEAWALNSVHVLRYPKAFYRAVKEGLDESIERLKLHRVQAVVAANHPRAHRWIKALGFEFEGVMRAYGYNGDDYAIYGRVTKCKPSTPLPR